MLLGGYILKFGDKSFSEFAFNDTDGALFAFLSYPNWEVCAPMLTHPNAEPFCFSKLTEQNIEALIKGSPTPNEHRKLLRAIVKTKRFKNVKVKYIEYRFDYERKQQYFALTYDIPGVGNYVCFRGTDLSILGWEEDFRLALNIVTNSQIDALEYLKKVSQLIDENFYVGGHSKGGNLAIYSAMNIDEKMQNKIIKIYSLDGPGFYDNAFYESSGYKNIENKIFQIIPRDSFVGVIFHTPKNYKIVSSSYLSVAQHSVYSWRVKKDGSFCYKKSRTYMSFVRQRALVKWLEFAPFETKILTIDSMVTSLGGSDKDLLLYLKHPGFIGKTIVLWNKKYTKEQKKIIFKFSRQLIKAYICSFFHFLRKRNRELAK